MLKLILLIATALIALLELFRGIFTIIWGYRDEHVTSIIRGWLVAFNGLILAVLAAIEYIYLF